MKFTNTWVSSALLVLAGAAAGCGVEAAGDEVSSSASSLEGGGNFSHSCTNVHLEPSSIWLHASCANTAGALVDTRIDLNNHLGNNNGGLTWWSAAAYATCSFHGLFTFRGDIGINADCKKVDGVYSQTAANLDQCIANWNGSLVYVC